MLVNYSIFELKLFAKYLQILKLKLENYSIIELILFANYLQIIMLMLERTIQYLTIQYLKI